MRLKILHATWNLFQKNENTINISPNGGSVMVFNICNWTGKKAESYAFCGNIKMQGDIYDNVRILANDKYLSDMDNRGENIEKWLCNINKAFEDCLDELNPDFVLIHGGLDFSLDCINSCDKKNKPYAYVSHLYQGKTRLYPADEKTAAFEDKVFDIPGINIIAVSNGMRKRILEERKKIDESRIVAIRNAVQDVEYNVEKKTNSKKNLLCVGTICPRKNQLQLLRAYSLLADDIKNRVSIILCGKDSKNSPSVENLKKLIKDLSLENNVKYLGTVSRDEMDNIYKNADGLIMTSLCEGLSLVVLEMLKHGKPVIMFKDNETADDVNNEQAVVFINEHSDECIVDAIIKWDEKKWDYNYIIDFSRKYNMEILAEQYLNYVRKQLENNKLKEEIGRAK